MRTIIIFCVLLIACQQAPPNSPKYKPWLGPTVVIVNTNPKDTACDTLLLTISEFNVTTIKYVVFDSVSVGVRTGNILSARWTCDTLKIDTLIAKSDCVWKL